MNRQGIEFSQIMEALGIREVTPDDWAVVCTAQAMGVPVRLDSLLTGDDYANAVDDPFYNKGPLEEQIQNKLFDLTRVINIDDRLEGLGSQGLPVNTIPGIQAEERLLEMLYNQGLI